LNVNQTIGANGRFRAERPWLDLSRSVEERVEALLAAMTLDEKLAQLSSVWSSTEDTGDVAPAFAERKTHADVTQHGIGQLTRVFGSRPIEPEDGAKRLAEIQKALLEQTRLGIPAIAHEECLTGIATLRATQFPTPLAWGASFDPEIVERVAQSIGRAMRKLGVHQGLAPVLDVVRDYRWGRVEETLGEDPYLVGMLGSAYVRGLESTGIVSTLKHFAGYSASRGARNHAPVSAGRREVADVLLPPFEMAIREGGARSVMNSYADVDGVPPAADETLFTSLLRDEWGFTGVVVSDYWAIPFLHTTQGVAATLGEAGALAIRAGIDVELPGQVCYGDRLAELVRAGEVSEALVDRSVGRVLKQKVELGLLDPDWSPQLAADGEKIDLDPSENRLLARELAERSIVLLSNRAATLPLAETVRSIAVVGPCADDPLAFLGCYSFSNHVLPRYPEFRPGLDVPTVLTALDAELGDSELVYVEGCPVRDEDRSGVDAAVEACEAADLCVAVVGDRAGLFGRGTSGEGCDSEALSLPGVQGELVDALLETSTPVVLVVSSGRPYALGLYVDRAAAIVQAFFAGEEGGSAIAGVLSGRVCPSGKLPVQIVRAPTSQTGTYLQPPLGRPSGMSSVDPTPCFAFGHGLSYTTFEYSDLRITADSVPTTGAVEISCAVSNNGDRAGTEVVQLYLGDPVAQVTRPVQQLAGFARVTIEPGTQARVRFALEADRTAFVGLDSTRIVEPGEIIVSIGSSSADISLTGSFWLTGDVRVVGRDRVLTTPVKIELARPSD
jgi:beta-xylosidase